MLFLLVIKYLVLPNSQVLSDQDILIKIEGGQEDRGTRGLTGIRNAGFLLIELEEGLSCPLQL